MIINYVVEGRSDIGFAQKLIAHCGHTVGKEIAKRGVANLMADAPKYREAARNSLKYSNDTGWLVICDSDGKCPVEIRDRLDPDSQSPENFSARVAVTMSESWALADRNAASEYFHIPQSKLPRIPDDVLDSKRLLLHLVKAHASKPFAADLVAGKSDMGPLFAPHMIAYAQDHWDIEAAQENSPSLRRAISAVRGMGLPGSSR